jgi:competence protein ComEA
VIRPLALCAGLLLSFSALADSPVNINSADAAAIAGSLDGIGLAKAEAIVAWRDEHGPFKSLADLSAVKGVGMALLERNREAIQFDEKPAKPAKAMKAAKAKADKDAAAE